MIHTEITSRDNQHLVRARKVRDGVERELIFIEGKRLTQEALRSEIEIVDAFVADDFGDQKLLNTLEAGGVSFAMVPARLFKTIADTDTSQGIILLAARPVNLLSTIEARLGNFPLVVFLKEINNPSNLGAILRTAEAAGVAGVITSTKSADVYSTKAIRAAMGSSFRVPVWENLDFEAVLAWAKKEKLIATAATGNADCSYTQINWKVPRLLIFGSEAHGLNSSELDLVDEKIRIPIEDNVESLNLAVSAGIMLFEAKRQTAAT